MVNVGGIVIIILVIIGITLTLKFTIDKVWANLFLSKIPVYYDWVNMVDN